MPKSRSKRTVRQPPPKAKPKTSPEWLGVLFFILLGTGIVILVANYMGLFPGGFANWRLFYGLALFCGALIVATQWH